MEADQSDWPFPIAYQIELTAESVRVVEYRVGELVFSPMSPEVTQQFEEWQCKKIQEGKR